MPSGGARLGTGRSPNPKRFSERVRKNYEAADKYFAQYLMEKDVKPRRVTAEMATVGMIFGLVWDRTSQTWLKAAVQDSVRIGAQRTRQEALVIRESCTRTKG